MNFFKYKANIVSIGFSLIFGLMLFPLNIRSTVIILFSLILLVTGFKNKNSFNIKWFLVSVAPFFITALTLAYTSNFQYGFSKLETMLSLFIFPILFSFISEKDFEGQLHRQEKLLLIFILSLTLFLIISFIYFVVEKFPFSGTIQHYEALINEHIGKFSIHPIYASLLCSLATIFNIHLLKTSDKKHIRITCIVTLFILVFFLILMSKKGALIGLFFISLFMILKGFSKRKMLIFVPSIIVITTIIFSIPKVKNRFKELITIENLTNKNINSTNIRVAIYKSTISIIKESPFFGHGIGDYNDVLIEQYKKDNQLKLVEDKYNSHNQYLSFVLIGGFFLLFVFLATYFFYFKIAIKNSDTLFLSILLFYGFIMLTENILEREHGVIFFAFLLNFFGLKNYIRYEKK